MAQGAISSAAISVRADTEQILRRSPMQAMAVRIATMLLVISCSALFSSCSLFGQVKPNPLIDATHASVTCSVKQTTVCHIALVNDIQSRHELEWESKGSVPGTALFSPASGTLPVGKSQDISVTFPHVTQCPITFYLIVKQLGSSTLPTDNHTLIWNCG